MSFLIISGTYSGIFDGTGMLDGLHYRLSRLIVRCAYCVTFAVGTMSNAVFCSQSAGVIMTAQLMKRPYENNSLCDDG